MLRKTRLSAAYPPLAYTLPSRKEACCFYICVPSDRIFTYAAYTYRLSRFPHHLQAVVVFLTISFKEVTEVKQGAMQYVFPVQVKRDEETAESAVTIKKRMYGFKLVMYHGCVNENRQVSICVYIALKVSHGFYGFMGRCGIKVAL